MEETKKSSAFAAAKKRKKNKQRNTAFVALVIALIALIFTIGILFAINRFYFKFTIEDGSTRVVEFGQELDDSDVTAVYTGTVFSFIKLHADVTRSGDINYDKLGENEVTYTATRKDKSGSISCLISIEDNTAPEITLIDDPDYYASPVGEYEEEGFTAIDNYDGDLTDQVERVATHEAVTYTVTDSHGNTATMTRTIIYKDVIAPVITLEGGEDYKVQLNGTYEEPGYTATDECDGDLTDQVTVTGTVDTTKLGDYALTYSVTDSAGNVGTVVRNVKVADTDPPELTLNGDTKVYIKVGGTYSEAGYSAIDATDGDVTDKVEVSGSVDTSKRGVYEITYSVTDSGDNTATKKRTIYVYNKQAGSATVNPGSKVVYLTFDDGPGPYTQQLLDILDKYGVKATFFVTNAAPAYQSMITAEANAGHTVAVHSATHDYARIYQSEEAFYADVETMENIIVARTGKTPTLLRFPGGSSNTVSRQYCPGIMTDLTQSVAKMGYRYCDWNVSSGDAGETTSTSVVVSNVESGIASHDISYVLQHDTKSYSVNGVEEIIAWGLANGYTFLPITDSTPMCHHGVNN